MMGCLLGFGHDMSIPVAPSTPIDWDLASNLIGTNTLESLATLQRSEAQLKDYDAFLAQLRTKWESTADYLRSSVFGGEVSTGSNGRLTAQMPEITEGQPLTVWRLNDFPYYFAADIEHHVLWSSEPLPSQAVTDMIQQRFPGQPTLYWINPAPLQSVTAIWHCHVLVRKH